MLHIFVCDDEPSVTSLLKTIICKIDLDNPFPLRVELACHHPGEFIDKLPKQASISNVYLLDIELGADKNGLEIAKAIRQFDPLGHIIFLTHYANYLPNTFEYHVAPIAFLTKDHQHLLENQLKKVFHTIHKQVTSQTDGFEFFRFKIFSRQYAVNIKDILFFEHLGNHKVSLVAQDQSYMFYGTLRNIIHKHPNLLQIHQAFVINPAYVESVDYQEKILTLANDANCPIGSTYLKKVKKKLS